MTEQYIVRRTRNGRYSDKGYTFDDSNAIANITKHYNAWGIKMFWVGFVLGVLCGVIL